MFLVQISIDSEPPATPLLQADTTMTQHHKIGTSSDRPSDSETGQPAASNVIPFPLSATGSAVRRVRRPVSTGTVNPADHHRFGHAALRASGICSLDQARAANRAAELHRLPRRARYSWLSCVDELAPRGLSGDSEPRPTSTLTFDTRRATDGVRVTITTYDGPPRQGAVATRSTFALGAGCRTVEVEINDTSVPRRDGAFRLNGTLTLLLRPHLPHAVVRFRECSSQADPLDLILQPGVVTSLRQHR